MRNIFYFFILGMVFLLLETTVLDALFKIGFLAIGLKTLAAFAPDTIFILVIYFALTKKFTESLVLAFLLGYLKDAEIMSGVWIDPFIFACSAAATNMLKRIVILKGTFSFVCYLFGISLFLASLWTFVSYNMFDNSAAFAIGLRVMFPNALVNSLGGIMIFPIAKKFDAILNGESEEFSGILDRRW